MKFTLQMELEWRLKNWKYWRLDGLSGYPSKATIAHFGEGVHIPISYSRPPFPLNHLLAQEMGAWINQMGYEHPIYKHIIEMVYLTNQPQWLLAKKCKMSLRNFKLNLQYAKNWLEGRLSIDDKDFDKVCTNVVKLRHNSQSIQKASNNHFLLS